MYTNLFLQPVPFDLFSGSWDEPVVEDDTQSESISSQSKTLHFQGYLSMVNLHVYSVINIGKLRQAEKPCFLHNLLQSTPPPPHHCHLLTPLQRDVITATTSIILHQKLLLHLINSNLNLSRNIQFIRICHRTR